MIEEFYGDRGYVSSAGGFRTRRPFRVIGWVVCRIGMIERLSPQPLSPVVRELPGLRHPGELAPLGSRANAR